jgi:transposase
VELRELKALEIAARSRIEFKDGAWLVPSQSSTAVYRVMLKPEGDTCPCEDFTLRGGPPCKHIHAARIVRERDHGGQPPKIVVDAVPKRPTYSQNWPAYNLAQHIEKHRFQVLLCDLCAGVEEPPPPKVGRRPTPLRDQVFAACFKVYSTLSSRRFACDLRDAQGKGYLSASIHPNTVNTYLERPELTPVLHALVERSALPLKAIETAFAPDSSGFSCSKFVRWYDEKYGVTRSGHDWVKVHLICGVKTGIVTAVRILDRDAGDCPQFKPLVEATAAAGFTVKEVPADKAYLSHENLELVERLGGTAFVPFKSNSQQGEAGTVWEKMYLYYQLRREEFLGHYHQRSNVESVFSAVKRKFGDSVRSKTEAAMVNEALCKILAHNLCCVILSQCELGIEAVFWDEQKEGPRDVLPMVRRPG